MCIPLQDGRAMKLHPHREVFTPLEQKYNLTYLLDLEAGL